jgi:biotin operon repressor
MLASCAGEPRCDKWAIQQRGIKPAAKIVLWHLCDRYHPDNGCFPSLDTLATDCEMSRRSVQDQIAALEAAGLVTIEKMPREGGRLPRNRYVLAFEKNPGDLGQNPPKANSALGKIEPPPLANSRQNLGQNLPPNSVRETK